MPTLLAALLLAAAAPAKLKVVLPDMTGVGVPAEKARFFTEHLAGRLAEVNTEVTTSRALQQLMGIERQKQLLGCSAEAGSCFAELASALGTDALVLGDLALIDGTFQVNLKIISGADGKVLGTHQATARSEGLVLEELDKAAFSLANAAALALKRAPVVPLASSGQALRTGGVVSLVVGGVSGAAGAVLLVLAGLDYGRIPQQAGQTPLPTSTVRDLAAEGKLFMTAGWVLAGVGVAALGLGIGLSVAGRPVTVRPTVVAGNGAATFLLGGTF